MQLVLGPLIGHTTDHTTRIWIHTDQASALPIECHVYADTACSRPIPGSPFPLTITEANNFTAVANIPLPEAARTYYYSFTYQGNTLGEASYSFRNLAQQADKLVFGVVSCHRPFAYHGEKRMHMWRRLHETLLARQAQFVLHVGDQLYADDAVSFWQRSAWQQALALFENHANTGDKSARIQQIYREAYQLYWDFPEHRRLMASFPHYMIWDDHDITNGWGSDIRHKDQDAQAVFAGAREVYRCFQHAHNPQNSSQPEALYYGFHHGHASFITLDLRGHRQSWNTQLLGTDQRNWFEQFLTDCDTTKTLFLTSSVPLFHLKRRFANLPILRNKSDISDQWSHEANEPDRQWLLARLIHWLQGNANRRVIILGGDVHVGTFAEARLQDNSGIRLFQATSSPVANKPAGLIDRLVRAVSDDFEVELESGKQLDVKIKQRFWQRNFLLVSVDNTGMAPHITLELFEEGKLEPTVKTID